MLREMPEAEQNLVWNLFSGDQQRIAAAFQRLQPRRASCSSLLNELLGYYGLEGIAMPFTMEDFELEVEQKILKKLTPQQRLQGLSRDERLQGLSAAEHLAGLSPAERLAGLSPEQLQEIENYLKKQEAAQDKTSPDPPNLQD